MAQMDLKALKTRCDDAYYNSGETVIDDEEYDKLTEVLGKTDDVGSYPRQNVVELPYWMGSLDKIKTQHEIDKWVAGYQNNYCITPKLDGVSCLFILDNAKNITLYTRGNGKFGSDISCLANNINNVRDLSSIFTSDVAIRGELVMKKKVFAHKYANRFSNSRNLVSGIVNSLHSEHSKDIDFIPYEIVSPRNNQLTPSNQFCMFQSLNILYDIVPCLNVKLLTQILHALKINYEYNLDGLVVQPDCPYIRNTSKNPSYMRAFKVQDDGVETTVECVKWNVSKTGCLKPRVKVKTVDIDGVKINYASGFNAKFIMENEIGPGSILMITRSGDIIPHIKKVLGKSKADFPSHEYKWDDNHTDIYLKNNNNELENTLMFTDKMPKDQAIKMMESFFKAIGVKNMGVSTVTKLYENGYKTVNQIFAASIQDFTGLKSFQEKSATRLYNSIHLVNPTLPVLLSSFGIPNLGLQKAESILKHIPNLLHLQNIKHITSIKGMPLATLQKIFQFMPSFRKFVKKFKLSE